MFLTLFACNVAAGIFRVPRCRWADSSSVNNSRDFISGALLQGMARPRIRSVGTSTACSTFRNR